MGYMVLCGERLKIQTKNSWNISTPTFVMEDWNKNTTQAWMLHQAISVHTYCSHSILNIWPWKYQLLHLYWKTATDMLKKFGCSIKLYLYMHIVDTQYVAMTTPTPTLLMEDWNRYAKEAWMLHQAISVYASIPNIWSCIYQLIHLQWKNENRYTKDVWTLHQGISVPAYNCSHSTSNHKYNQNPTFVIEVLK